MKSLDPNVPEKPYITCYVRAIFKFKTLTCHNRGNPFSIGCLYAYLIADVSEHLSIAERDEGKFAEIRVCRKVFQGVQLQDLSKY